VVSSDILELKVRKSVIEDGVEMWKKGIPRTLKSNRVLLREVARKKNVNVNVMAKEENCSNVKTNEGKNSNVKANEGKSVGVKVKKKKKVEESGLNQCFWCVLRQMRWKILWKAERK